MRFDVVALQNTEDFGVAYRFAFSPRFFAERTRLNRKLSRANASLAAIMM